MGLLWTILCCLQQPAPATPELGATLLVDCGAPLVDMTLDDARVFTLSEAGALAAWSLRDAKSVWTLELRGAQALDVAGANLFAILGTPSVRRVDAARGTAGETLAGPKALLTKACTVDAQGTWAWIGLADGLGRLSLEAKGGWVPVELEGSVTALALDPTGAQLAAGCKDGSVRFVNARNGEIDYQRVLRGPGHPVTVLAFAPKTLIAASEDGSLRLWNPSSAMVKAELRQNGACVRVLAVASKLGWFASGDTDGNVLLWQLPSGAVRAHWKVDRVETSIAAVAFAADGKTLYAAAGSRVLALDLGGVK